MSKTITLKPRLNEKTYGLAESRVYVFDVERAVNKHSIARAVEAQFEVKVLAVNTTNISGKAKRVISINGKRMRNAEGSRGDIKKAYVTLAEGNALPFFDAIEEETQKEEAVQAKVDKAAAKQAVKEDKKAGKKTDKAVATTNKPAAKVTKPAAKAATKSAPATDKLDNPATSETADKKLHIPAWRGFRLRKSKKDDN
jgi:large subunit ribosomal protein L23